MSECIEWDKHRDKDGYGKKQYKGRPVAIHRLTFFEHYGYWPEICRHTCDNRACYNIDHLLDGTHEDNMSDMTARNRQSKGSHRPASKLDESAVRDIKSKLADPTHVLSAIAAQYGVSYQCIASIRDGHTWKHVN